MTDKTTTLELKPCPFCNDGASVFQTHAGGYSVGCDCCNAMMDTNSRTSAMAIGAWNTRAALADRQSAPVDDGLPTSSHADDIADRASEWAEAFMGALSLHHEAELSEVAEWFAAALLGREMPKDL